MEETPKPPRPDREASRGSRILVIDDEKTIHISLKRILGRQGHQVDAVFGAPEALELLTGQRYDLVITDLMMPEMSGMQLLQRLREEGHDLPVLMITGYPTIRTAMESLRLGAVDYVSKPFTRQELLGPVNRALRRAAGGSKPSGDETNDAEGTAPALADGDRLVLREHSWAVARPDGSMMVGIEASFLETLDAVTSLELPVEGETVEQGYAGFKLKTRSGEEHSVLVPLSGQVVSVNRQAADDPSSVEADTWLVVVAPRDLQAELSLLVRSRRD
jgi:DNA-binding response OmpR family regulator